MPSKLYYRADSRSPDEIFTHGFQPRVNDEFKLALSKWPWWMGGLRHTTVFGDSLVFPDDFSYYEHSHTQTMDANTNNVISMSTAFETTPIFPIDQTKEVYVYIMALPEATIPEHIGQDTTYDEIEVFDLHALQVRQAQNIIRSQPKENPGFVAQGLGGYEAFIQKIAPSQIIGVVKCKRSALVYNTAGAEVFPSTTRNALSYSRWFQMQGRFTCNSNFNGDSQLVEQAIEKVRAVKAKGLQFTSSVVGALQASAIEYDPKQLVTTTFFWNEFTHLNFLSAISSLLASIQYFISLLCHYITRDNSKTLTIEAGKDIKPTELLPQLGLFRNESVAPQRQMENGTFLEVAVPK